MVTSADPVDLRGLLGREVDSLARWVLDRDPDRLVGAAPGRRALSVHQVLQHLVDVLAGDRAPVDALEQPLAVVYQLLVVGHDAAAEADGDLLATLLAEVVIHREEIGGGAPGREVTAALGGSDRLVRRRADCPLPG